MGFSFYHNSNPFLRLIVHGNVIFAKISRGYKDYILCNDMLLLGIWHPNAVKVLTLKIG